MKGQDALFSKKSDEWETPQWLFDLLDKEFHFQIDAASTSENTKCKNLFRISESTPEGSLGHEWVWLACDGSKSYWKTFWLNPPYSKIAAFMKKAYEESLKGAVVVCLIPCRTDTRYWHDYVMKSQEIRFVKGRLKFGNQENSAPFPSCVVVFNSHNFPLVGYPMIGRTIEQSKKARKGRPERS